MKLPEQFFKINNKFIITFVCVCVCSDCELCNFNMIKTYILLHTSQHEKVCFPVTAMQKFIEFKFECIFRLCLLYIHIWTLNSKDKYSCAMFQYTQHFRPYNTKNHSNTNFKWIFWNKTQTKTAACDDHGPLFD